MVEEMSQPSAAGGPSLEGTRVLLVEDNYLVASLLMEHLESMGCQTIGPVASVEEGLDLVASAAVDLAVLDINIIGGTSVPIASALEIKHVPFFFVTGYGSPKMLPPSLSARRRLNKPVNQRMLREAMLDAISGSPS